MGCIITTTLLQWLELFGRDNTAAWRKMDAISSEITSVPAEIRLAERPVPAESGDVYNVTKLVFSSTSPHLNTHRGRSKRHPFNLCHTEPPPFVLL